MPSAVARLWITSRMSARSKFSTMASSSPSGRSDSGAGSAGAGGFCAHAGGPASTAATLTIASIHCPFTASSSLRKGSGLVDAPGRRLVGAQGEYPLHALLKRLSARSVDDPVDPPLVTGARLPPDLPDDQTELHRRGEQALDERKLAARRQGLRPSKHRIELCTARPQDHGLSTTPDGSGPTAAPLSRARRYPRPRGRPFRGKG